MWSIFWLDVKREGPETREFLTHSRGWLPVEIMLSACMPHPTIC